VDKEGGGCREAWLTIHHCDAERIGRTYLAANSTPFAARCEGPSTCEHRR
jgi:hypothetical protein